MKKRLAGRHLSLIVLGVIFVMWNILAWVLVDYSKANLFFYGGYGFAAFAFLLTAIITLVIKPKNGVIFSVTMPSYLVTAGYMLIAFVMNTIFMCFPGGKSVLGLVLPNVFLLLIFIALFAVTYFLISHVGKNSEVVEKNVRKLRLNAVEIGQIAAIAEDAQVKSALLDLREAVEYSDPMGVAETASYEEEFVKKISEIRLLVEENCPTESILGKVKSAKNKLVERNEILRTLK